MAQCPDFDSGELIEYLPFEEMQYQPLFGNTDNGVERITLEGGIIETIDWFNKNSEEALDIVAKKTKESIPVLRETLKAKRVRFLQLTAESQEKAMMELFKQGVDIGMIAKLPDANFFYRGLR